MRLVRIATIDFQGPPEGEGISGMTIGECAVDLILQKPRDTGVLQCVAASKRLLEPLACTTNGKIAIPAAEREELEDAISHYAHLNSVSKHRPCVISSASPSVAFIPEDDGERELLETSQGISYPTLNRAFPRTRYTIGVSDLDLYSDRLDGLALLAQSLNNTPPSAQFMTHVRLLERAFSRPLSALTGKLAKFLGKAGLGYTKSEVKEWVQHRHGISHADMTSKPIILDVDVSWICGRTEQAAFDVFTNKQKWGSPDVERREAWRPICGTVNPQGGLLATRGHAFEAEMTVFDEFRRFPLNLEGVLTGLPAGWWSVAAPAEN